MQGLAAERQFRNAVHYRERVEQVGRYVVVRLLPIIFSPAKAMRRC
jgi:hypothetical protein